MQYDILRLFFTIVVAFLVAYASTPIVKILAAKIGAIDVPNDDRRMHKKPIPRLGGVAIFYGFIVSILCFCEINESIRGILIGSVIIVAVGVLDDVIQLKATYKLIGQILAAGVVVFHNVRIDYLTNPNLFSQDPYISLGIWAIPITIIWIVGVTNAVNLIDGLDGLAVGVSSISSASTLNAHPKQSSFSENNSISKFESISSFLHLFQTLSPSIHPKLGYLVKIS